MSTSALKLDADTGIVIVDHGSRREESNLLLNDVVAMFKRVASHENVEVAHMELAEPTIADAFGACIDSGARRVVVFPYFLSPGRHWSDDIPRLAAEASRLHNDVEYLVTAPLGLHSLIGEVIAQRITTCMHASEGGPPCDLCGDKARCKH